MMDKFNISEQAKENAARLANDMDDIVGAQRVILDAVTKCRSKEELKAIAYDKFLETAEIGSLDMKVSAITLTAIYHAEMAIQNKKIAKEEARGVAITEVTKDIEKNPFKYGVENRPQERPTIPDVKITKEYLDFLLSNKYIAIEAYTMLLNRVTKEKGKQYTVELITGEVSSTEIEVTCNELIKIDHQTLMIDGEQISIPASSFLGMSFGEVREE